jgi:hypothetical protein
MNKKIVALYQKDQNAINNLILFEMFLKFVKAMLKEEKGMFDNG